MSRVMKSKEEWKATNAISQRTSEKKHLDFDEKKPELSGDKSRLLETVKPQKP